VNEPISSQDERIRQAAEQLFAQAEHFSELTRSRVLELAGGNVGRRAFDRVFPGNQFTLLRQAWLRNRIEGAMKTVFATAKVQRDVTFQKVADVAGCSDDAVIRLVGDQFLARRAALEDSQERMLQAIQRLVDAKISPQEYTWARVYAEADERPMHTKARVNRAFRDGLESLVQYHEQQRQQRITGATYACIQGTWVNVDEPIWFLPGIGKTLRCDHLRPDIAAVAWPLLREEALSVQLSAYTLSVHYQGCISVAKLLGEIIPDIQAITLNAIQQAWLRFEASNDVRKHLRTMLVRMLEALIVQGATDAMLNVQEYGRVVSWLRMINLSEPTSDKAYLSESEFDALLDGCLEDIVHGLAYTRRSGPTVEQQTFDIHAEDVVSVFHWGVALIILVMAFTGLRRQSIARLTVDDIAQIGPEAFALAWRHGKPGKERIAIIPTLVAEHLYHYIHTTAPVRKHLKSQHIFLARNRSRRWDHMTVDRVTRAFDSFGTINCHSRC
jgi:integrase